MKTQHKRLLQRAYIVMIFGFMYLPIAVLIAYSFNENKSRTVFSGFTLSWYKSLFQNEMILSALGLSLVLALVSSVLATVLGTLATIGINSMSRRTQLIVNNISYVPVVNPEIITGISLMLMFVFVGQMMGLSTSLNFGTILIAHVTFCLPFVILQVLPKLRQMDKNLVDAAQDLGCTWMQAFWKVIIPEIKPGIISGALIAFTMSIDDFIISYFTAGSGVSTLAMTIYSMTKKRVSPEINAISTLLFGAVLLLLIIINVRESRQERLRERARA